MKINAIQGYNSNYGLKTVKTQPETPKSAENNMTLPSYAYRPIFKAAGPDMVKKVMDTPLDDKLAVAFKKMQPLDRLFVAADMNKAADVIKQSIDSILLPVTRLLFLQVPKMRETVMFTSDLSAKRMWNLGKGAIIVDGFDFVQPDQVATIFNGQHVKMSGRWQEIKDEPETDFDLEQYSSMFLKIYDYDKEARQCLKTHNEKVLTEIFQPEQKKKANNISFAMVGGQDENIDILKKNVLYPMKYPEVFENFMLNRGVILSGPPGTGKTLLAKALVAEAGASAFELCATDLSAKFVGESEKNCRELFERAVEAQPSIIYFDEFDALAKSRGSSDVYGDKLLNQLLSLMSDIEKRKDNVFVIASTNRKDAIDPAILRSGRFGLQLEVNAPNLDGTKQILKIHTKGKPVDKNLDMEKLAQNMFDKKMTGAEIADVVKRAYSNALERTGIYKSMEENRFSPQMLDYLYMTEADFEKALKELKTGDKGPTKIGFKK